ncbi:MAG: hypothetical protein JWR16_1413 [Nevskia sp.]|nr:hypothetical protein [Nevskia sp.]
MKDKLAIRCFIAAVIILSCWGIVGALISGRIPFIASSVVRTLANIWIPALTVGGWFLALASSRDSRDVLGRRKMVELYAKFGKTKASVFVALSGLFWYVIFLGAGNAGISKSTVFLSSLLPSTNVVLDVPFLGVHNFSGRTSSLQWMKITIDGHVDQFSYPASRLTFLPCASDKIRISGNSSWVGIRVNHVECSP